ncbi:uncharacterized protein N7496_009783 [Penicillium cataractarum]|uniref:Restriction of telomere capping protein 4 n=1 Tax=Penicillium cataractarum TaxID=2100454 RepID=A0A9W9RPL0_9EURO|nr:uncharacterized protein N7496_009783 [Penicillium cataractarum]KAJ5364070.1 hypothetical protein N7496_009783 [Penicillium cataractarum]
MRPGAKRPDSSHVLAAGLTRNVNLGRHLLSTYNKPEAKNIDTKPREPKSTINELPVSSDDEELTELSSADFENDSISESQDEADQEPESKPKAENEPATDDEPVSTSEDESIDDGLDFQRPKKRTFEFYKEKKSGRADRGGMGDEDSFMMWSSQGSKRAKSNTYGSATSFSRTPSYVRSPATPDKSSPRVKSQTPRMRVKKEDKKSTSNSQPDNDFIVAKEIHRSCPKISESSPGSKMPSAIPASSNPNSTLANSSFREPFSMDLDAEDSPLSSLSSLPSSPASQPEYLGPALCPMCKKEVDPELLAIFRAQPKQRVREQQQFCASHQQHTAEKEWESQGYPTINWDTFDQRVQKHFSALERLLVPDCSSYYRNILDTALKSGKARNFRLTLAGDGLETMSCGYYGTKGSGKMLQLLTDRFAVKLRRLATSDHIVKQAGVVGYAQSVLVPELAIRLVKEDMAVNDDAARQILRESIALGEKLNPALDDEVPIPDDLAETFEDEA